MTSILSFIEYYRGTPSPKPHVISNRHCDNFSIPHGLPPAWSPIERWEIRRDGKPEDYDGIPAIQTVQDDFYCTARYTDGVPLETRTVLPNPLPTTYTIRVNWESSPVPWDKYLRGTVTVNQQTGEHEFFPEFEDEKRIVDIRGQISKLQQELEMLEKRKQAIAAVASFPISNPFQ